MIVNTLTINAKLKMYVDNKPRFWLKGGDYFLPPQKFMHLLIILLETWLIRLFFYKLFDPSQIDARGRTKLQRMKQGLAPVGYDGKSVNLHHIDQTNASDILEISATQHHADYSKLHTNTGQSASLINRSDFSKWRSRYWQFRAEDFLKA